MDVDLEGGEEVLRVLQRLSDAAQNLGPAHQAAGQLLLGKADNKVPRRSGRLAASGRVDASSDEARVVYDEVYAGVIHNGWPAHNIAAQPWLAETLSESPTDVTGVYVDYLNDAIST